MRPTAVGTACRTAGFGAPYDDLGPLRGPLARAPFDVIVMDPPRHGCSAEVLEAVFGRLRPQRVACVSCNPEALARDLATAGRAGFIADSVQPIDMFPHTPHIEAVASLRRP